MAVSKLASSVLNFSLCCCHRRMASSRNFVQFRCILLRAVLAFCSFSLAVSSRATALCMSLDASLGEITVTLFSSAWISGVSSRLLFLMVLTKFLSCCASADIVPVALEAVDDGAVSFCDTQSGSGGGTFFLELCVCLGCCRAGDLVTRCRGEG